MLLSIQISLVVCTLALQACSYDLDIDLNQPASPAEDSPTAEMIRTTDRVDDTIKKVSLPQSIPRMKEQRLLQNFRQRQRYHETKKDPKKYEAILKQRRDYKKSRYSNLDERKNNERKAFSSYMQRKLEEDPNFQRTDRRKDLRKRVREGIATKEDLQMYDELKAKHAAGQRASAKPCSVKCVSPPHSPQPIAGDVDRDFLDPLLETDISHSLIPSPIRAEAHQSPQLPSQQPAPSHTNPTASLSKATNIDIRKIPKASGKRKLTLEEKKERHALKQRIYRQNVQKDPMKHEAQKEKTKVRYQKWWQNLPTERADEIRERNMHTARAYRQRVAKATPPKTAKKSKRTKKDPSQQFPKDGGSV
ncbi:uncharacterized protein FA14DRAFT_175295 [Meira miltonrushii]|uniref:Uncharacterized protein n=1 Tax=Meira miltonrushii TaxID=1280837 RepID=A0A316V842_9BASI|nr:uncharacterized protein FA14DRAFT_175295 [Meira miltonrushii]PWN31625.1 hypothetical protein FA14DRAFT_175295 [Meira miltonrushii]